MQPVNYRFNLKGINVLGHLLVMMMYPKILMNRSIKYYRCGKHLPFSENYAINEYIDEN